MAEFGGADPGTSADLIRQNFGLLSTELPGERDAQQAEDFELALAVAEGALRLGGFALLVGGYTRDLALRRLGKDVIPKDLDIEIYGLSLDRIMDLLEQIRPGASDVVGVAFGVIKFGGSMCPFPVGTPRSAPVTRASGSSVIRP